MIPFVNLVEDIAWNVTPAHNVLNADQIPILQEMGIVNVAKVIALLAIKQILMNVRVAEEDLLQLELRVKKFAVKIVFHAVILMYANNVLMDLL